MPLAVGHVLRAAEVEDARTGRTRRVPFPPDGVNVLVFPHGDCRTCTTFLRDLEGRRDGFDVWGCSLRAVTADGAVAQSLLDAVDLPVLVDPGGRLHDAAAVTGGSAAVLVLDVHGQVFFGRDLDDHGFPSVEELVSEARFPALQCPECDTPDVPSQAVWGEQHRGTP